MPKVSEEDYQKAGGDPKKIPAIAERIKNVSQEVAEEQEAQESARAHKLDALEMMPDETPLFGVVAGVPLVRDVTAGVYNILTKLKSPLFTDVELSEEDFFNEMAFLLFLMSYEDERQLVRWFMTDELKEEYFYWSMNNISLNHLMAEQDYLMNIIESVGVAASEAPEPEDSESTPKK